MSEVLIFGRRRPRIVESVDGVITDVITPNFVEVTQPAVRRPVQQVIYENRYPFPYSLVLLDERQPQIIAVRYRPKSKVIITPYSELVLE